MFTFSWIKSDFCKVEVYLENFRKIMLLASICCFASKYVPPKSGRNSCSYENNELILPTPMWPIYFSFNATCRFTFKVFCKNCSATIGWIATKFAELLSITLGMGDTNLFKFDMIPILMICPSINHIQLSVLGTPSYN